MTNNKFPFVKIISYILMFFACLACVIMPKMSAKTPMNIFNESVKKVVEVKACSNLIGASYGTGVVYDINGYIITNAHIVSYDSASEKFLYEKYEVRFTTENTYHDASLLKCDYEKDLAILKIEISVAILNILIYLIILYHMAIRFTQLVILQISDWE
ncbi:MAG: trypsin-like peptidase domain-containing protein [Bacilli bacterium]|nr:trypsin-like peptidase domain-containing protein [Bacilli bacterium]